MKKRLLFFLFITNFSLVIASSTYFSRLDADRIEAEADSFEELLQRNAWHRRCAYGAVGLGACALLYCGLKPAGAKACPTCKDTETSLQALNGVFVGIDSKDRAAIGSHLAQSAVEALNASRRGFFMGPLYWCKDQAGYVLSLAAASELMLAVNGSMGPVGTYLHKFEGFVGRHYEKLFFEVTLEWYLRYYARLKPLFIQMEVHSALLEGHEVTYDTDLLESSTEVAGEQFVDSMYHENGLVQSWKLFNEYMYGLLGYIHYKELHALEKQELIGKRFADIKARIIALTNQTADLLNEELGKRDEPTGFFSLIKHYRAALEIEIKSFADFESFLMN